MWVRQKIGRTAGAIVEMNFDAAQSALASGVVVAVSDEELKQAGFPSQGSMAEEPVDKLLADYRIEPSKSGQGFDIFDAGGVRLNEEGKPLHNHAAARDAAHALARAARGLPPADKDKRGKDGKLLNDTKYEAMKPAELDKAAADRGVDLSSAKTPADKIALLRHADKVRAAIEAEDYAVLTRPELDKLAAERHVDVSKAKTDADVVAALKKK
jgi:hypothetical protein